MTALRAVRDSLFHATWEADTVLQDLKKTQSLLLAETGCSTITREIRAVGLEPLADKLQEEITKVLKNNLGLLADQGRTPPDSSVRKEEAKEDPAVGAVDIDDDINELAF